MFRLSSPRVVHALLGIALLPFISSVSSVAGMASAIPTLTQMHAQGKPCLPGESGGALICYTPAERAMAEARLPEPLVNPDVAVSQTTGLTLTQISIDIPSLLSITATTPVAGINYIYGDGAQRVVVSEYVFDEPVTDTRVLTGTRVTTDTETDTNNGVSVVNIRGWSFVANLFARHLSLSVGSSQSLAVVETIGNALVQEAGGTAATVPPTTATATPQLTLTVARKPRTLTVHVTTTPGAWVALALQLPAALGRAPHTSTPRWTTVARTSGAADATGVLSEHFRLTGPLAHSARAQLVVTARTATGTTRRTMTVRLR